MAEGVRKRGGEVGRIRGVDWGEEGERGEGEGGKVEGVQLNNFQSKFQ